MGSRRFKKCFIGSELVDFLIAKGVAKERKDAEKIGKALFDAGAVTHVQDEHGFRDKAYFYKFVHANKWEVSLDTLRKCKEEIGKEHTSGLKSYPDTFFGSEFIDWLLENEVHGDRAEAEGAGRELFEAGQLQHIHNQHKFKDDKTLLYKLVLPPETGEEKKRRKEEEERSRQLVYTADNWAAIAEQGAYFLKHGRTGKPHKRRLRVDARGRVEWDTGSCNLIDAEDVSPGKNTKLLQKVEHKVADPRMCFSIVLPNRSLDLQARTEEERDFWVKGLRELRERLLREAEVVLPDEHQRLAEEEEGEEERSPRQHVHAAFDKESWQALAWQGVTFLKHGRHGKPHDRIIKVDSKRGALIWETGNLNLKDAVDIIKGKKTKTFQSVKHSEAAPAVCFSILMPNRSLDLQAADQHERDNWVQGLRELKGKFDPHWQMRRASFKHARSEEEDWDKEWKQASEGTLMLKYGRHGKPHDRLLKLSGEILDWETGNVDLKHVVDIVAGKTTKQLHSVKDSVANPHLCFSVLLSKDRNLNLQATSEHVRDMWVKGLRAAKGQLDPKWLQRRRSWIINQREEAQRKHREEEMKAEAEVREVLAEENEMLPLHLIDQLSLELGQMADFETLAEQLGLSLLPPPPPAPGDANQPRLPNEPVFSEEGNTLTASPEEWAKFEHDFEAHVRKEIEEEFRKTIVSKRTDRDQMKLDVIELRLEVEKRMETVAALKAEMRGLLSLHTELQSEFDALAAQLEPLKHENKEIKAAMRDISP